METRRFGRTEHQSTVAILGGAAFRNATPEETAHAMEWVIASGVNHIDVAPSYGMAETRLGPWLAADRNRFFLGCKTLERTREGAWLELHRSLERLQVESLDLYQMHAVNSQQDLDQAFGPGGAWESLQEARERGLTRYLGITGHGLAVPGLFLQALARFDLDSVLFPLNAGLYANPAYRESAQQLIQVCQARDIGMMVIKSVCRGPWQDKPRQYATWYEPFDQPAEIQAAVNFALSQEITGLCSLGDLSLLPHFIKACELATRLTAAQQEEQITAAARLTPLFV